MAMKTWKAAAVLMGSLAITFGAGELVHAEESWEHKAAAKVESYANIREEASKDADIAGVLPNGAVAEVEETNEEWTKVTSGEIEGYIKTDLLVFAGEAAALYEETYGNKGTVTASSLRVRKEPSLEAEKIGSKRKESTVEILGQEGEWFKIQYTDEKTGYVFGEYIEIKEFTAMTVDAYEEQKRIGAAAGSVSGAELDLLAAIIQCEAGGESHTGKVAVGAVIMNRIRSSQFPNTITDVVYQPRQFSPVASGKLASVLSQGARSDCYQAAQEALAGSNPVGDCLYFNSGYGRGIQIGNQHFY